MRQIGKFSFGVIRGRPVLGIIPDFSYAPPLKFYPEGLPRQGFLQSVLSIKALTIDLGHDPSLVFCGFFNSLSVTWR